MRLTSAFALRVLPVLAASVALGVSGCAPAEEGSAQDQGLGQTTLDSGMSAPFVDAAAPVLDGATADAAAPTVSGLPCDVAKVVAAHCATCHGADLAAPMPLLSHADFVRPAISAPERKVYELVTERAHDARRPMPPLSAGGPLAAAELATLDAWIAAGAPQSEDSCQVEGPAEPEAAVDLSECDILEEFRAYDDTKADKETPYVPPQVEDHYRCFNFPVPWDGDVHGLRFDPLIVDKRVVHHWILFSTTDANPPKENGCSDNRLYLSGWAPGPGGKGMPDGVGLEMPKKGQTLQLEVHYNNVRSYTDVKDNSGVRVCATRKLRENTAAVHWLGALGILLGPGAVDVTNTCLVNTGMGPVTVISSWPHMHKLAVHMKTEVLRKDGSIDVILDTPYDFRDQTDHPVEIVVQQGDRLRTTCSYVNDTGRLVVYGEGTDDEMCLNFVTAYPAGGLSSAPNNQNRCMGLL